MKTIHLNNISIDIHEGPVGISVSGGADSAILLYVLAKYHSDPIYVYTCSNKEKGNRNPHHALDVISKCIELTGNYNIVHRTYFVHTQTYDSLFTNLTKLSRVDGVKKIYTAVTANPPRQQCLSWSPTIPLADKRDPEVMRPLYSENGYYYTPFFNIDKSVIKKLYDELAVTDKLFPLTRSCESTVIYDQHCGSCWWCGERQWAFGKLQ